MPAAAAVARAIGRGPGSQPARPAPTASAAPARPAAAARPRPRSALTMNGTVNTTMKMRVACSSEMVRMSPPARSPSSTISREAARRCPKNAVTGSSRIEPAQEQHAGQQRQRRCRPGRTEMLPAQRSIPAATSAVKPLPSSTPSTPSIGSRQLRACRTAPREAGRHVAGMAPSIQGSGSPARRTRAPPRARPAPGPGQVADCSPVGLRQRRHQALIPAISHSIFQCSSRHRADRQPRLPHQLAISAKRGSALMAASATSCASGFTGLTLTQTNFSFRIVRGGVGFGARSP